jgi:predicted metal-dependent HD superfamily phosphohydrolase
MDDLPRWSNLWTRLGGVADPRPVYDELVRAYTSASRAYHTLEHVRDCLRQLDQFPALAEQADEVEMALWAHDVVYEPRASNNEERSAEWARRALLAGRVPPPNISRISQLILATRHRAVPEDPDAILVVDVDLSILGRPEPEFDRYEQRIRLEYAWVPEATYCEARARILESFLQREHIFGTRPFRDRYEAHARTNLGRSVRNLRLGKISPRLPSSGEA